MNQNTPIMQDSPGKEVAQSPQDLEITTGGERASSGAVSALQRRTPVLPPVDIFEDETGFTVIADLPGVSKERLAVRIDGDSLVIEGAASAPVSGAMELVYGEMQNPLYRRSFTLSRELDPGKIEARLANGVLKLSIPKAEEARPRRIEVAVA